MSSQLNFRRALAAALALATVAALAPVRAQAQDLAPVTHATEARIAELRDMMANEALRAKRWWYTWLTIFGGAAVGQYGAALIVDDPGLQHRGLVGGTAAMIGVGSVVISPIPSGRAMRSRAAAHIDALADLPPDQQLAQMEAWMVRTEKSLRFGKSWLSAAGGIVVGSGQWLTLWLVYDQFWDGVLAFGMSQAVGLTKLFSTPQGIRERWHDYQDRWAIGSAAAIPRRVRPTWSLLPTPRGAELAVRF